MMIMRVNMMSGRQGRAVLAHLAGRIEYFVSEDQNDNGNDNL